ncbi:choice-of-anchor A family protein [Streptomyces gobiensis]|uniref:choice-of-anchor A family protein n=1 Tax=Streptomyces gobiensis TaxID=2875706 RepID=UPI001E5D92B2|nr:choice-of-anchor A family protein [Streptomyces gobiensis]UGY91171.1 choice-of-anchor A family protein [Streptomyces gobiensis]
MRLSASVAAVLVGGSLALALPGTASASASSSCRDHLGIARSYNEFIEGDAVHTSDSEGAIAIGGDADFTEGFSLGRQLSTTEKLPGGATLVVGGTLRNGAVGSDAFTVLERGTAVYGALEGRPAVLKSGSRAMESSTLFDFAAEFGKLRKLSATLGARPAQGSVTRTISGGDSELTLTGEDSTLNVFPVSAIQLASAQRIVFEFPKGATALVNVSGSTYDMSDGGTHDISGPPGLPSKLLWNFLDATAIVKQPGTSWPGTVLAPHATVDLGTSGPLKGTVIAKSLTAAGAETHHVPFTGCLSAQRSAAAESSPTGDLADTGVNHLRALLSGALGALTAGAGLSYAAYSRRKRS